MIALSHICRSVMGRKYTGRFISVMGSEQFSCRWDESGVDPGTKAISKTRGPMLLVAGYMAHVDEWENLERRWAASLKEYGLEEYGFHMVEFFRHGYPYSKLKDDEYDSLIQALLDIIRDCPRFYVSWSLNTNDYMNVIKARNLLNEDIVRAYHILARRCIEVVSDLARLANHREKILHIFDSGNSAWPSFEASFTDEMLRALNILKPISQSDHDVISLQAADVLAHQLGRKRTLKVLGKVEHKKVYIDRLSGKPGIDLYIDGPNLLEAYRRELYLEQHKRSPGLVRGFLQPADPYHAELAREMFKHPEEYPFNERLRELQ
jgi:hypothetical protein